MAVGAAHRALAVTAVCAAAAFTGALLPPAAGAAVITRAMIVQWPLRQGTEVVFTKAIPLGSATVKKVTATFPGGARVDDDPEYDYIVACAHRGPAFAKLAWLTLDGLLWVTVALEPGGCTGGPTVAGRAARVVIDVTTA